MDGEGRGENWEGGSGLMLGRGDGDGGGGVEEVWEEVWVSGARSGSGSVER